MAATNAGTVAPIALFVYNRLWHTRQTVEALQGNRLAKESNLFIFSDAAKRPDAAPAVQQVREYVKTIEGFRSVHLIERVKNLGLANSIIDGTKSLVTRYGRIIVLEDDMVTSPHFLTYMNNALERYVDDDRVISIHGYVYPIDDPLPEVFFLRGADCWGWATWSRGWALFNEDGTFLLKQLKTHKLNRAFDFGGTYPYTKMLEDQIRGKNDSWAVRWYASAFLAGKLTLYPRRSLVQNIGNDSSGAHCGTSNSLDTQLIDSPLNVDSATIEESTAARRAFERFFKRNYPGFGRRLVRKIKRFAMAERL